MVHGSVLSLVALALLASSAVLLPACTAPTSEPLEETGVTSSALTDPSWEWVNVPGTKCGYSGDTMTGLAINRGTGSDLVIYLSGGGICWEEASCLYGGDLLHLVENFRGYNESTFQAELNQTNAVKTPTRGGIFDRTRADNPYKNSSYVYVPYCTGDAHAGTNVVTGWLNGQKGNFVGRTNLEKFLTNVVVPRFSSPSRVTLAGSSAGGWGAEINYAYVKSKFPTKRVDLIDDSGPLMDGMAALNMGSASWNTAAAMPAGCPSCLPNYSELYAYNARLSPDARFGFMSYDGDQVMALAEVSPNFAPDLRALELNKIRPITNTRFFTPAGTQHTTIGSLDTRVSAGTSAITLGAWLTQLSNGSTAWSNRTSWGTTCPTGTGTIAPASNLPPAPSTSSNIEAKFIELGGCGSFLGAPTSNEVVLPDMSGRANQFANGSIYWHASAGAHEIHGVIRQYWADRGWELSGWGYPTTDEVTVSVGKKQLFKGGGIYWSAATSVHGVLGGIYTKYAAIGAEASALGLPTTDEFATGPFGLDRRQNFQRGYIYFSQLGGPGVVYN